MDFEKQTKQTLTAKCKELGIKGYSGKTKPQLVELIAKYYADSSSQQIMDEPLTHTPQIQQPEPLISIRCSEVASPENFGFTTFSHFVVVRKSYKNRGILFFYIIKNKIIIDQRLTYKHYAFCLLLISV